MRLRSGGVKVRAEFGGWVKTQSLVRSGRKPGLRILRGTTKNDA